MNKNILVHVLSDSKLSSKLNSEKSFIFNGIFQLKIIKFNKKIIFPEKLIKFLNI